MQTHEHHDDEAGVSIMHWTDEHGSYPCSATLMQYPDKLILVSSSGVHVYDETAKFGDLEGHHALWAWLVSNSGSSFIADKIMNYLYAGHPPSRELPLGKPYSISFLGRLSFMLQAEGTDEENLVLAKRITEGILGELDAAADVWLDFEREPFEPGEDEWPNFAVHSLSSTVVTDPPAVEVRG